MAVARMIVALFVAVLVVSCSDSSAPGFNVGGTVTGLSSAGLVLQNNGGNNLTIANTGGSFTFSKGIASGGAYIITVLTQPAYQHCTVSNGAGTIASASVTNVSVTCTTSNFALGGTVTGLSGTGLVLQNSGTNNLTITADGNFILSPPIASGTAYSVTVQTQPTNSVCTVTNGSGILGKANISTITVTCVSPFEGHQVLTASGTTGAVGALGTIFVVCPGTKKVLSGGYRSGSGSEVWRVWSSRPVDAAGLQSGDRGWAVSFTSVVAGQAVTVHAVCATPEASMGYEVATASVATGQVGALGSVSVICPGVRRMMGGGFSSNPLEVWRVGRSRAVDDFGVVTGIRGWAIDFVTVVAGQNVNAHATCAQAPQTLGHQVVTASVTTGSVGALGSVTATCPVGKRVLGGGFITPDGSEVWRVWRNYPVDAGVQVGDRGWSVEFTSVVAAQTVSVFAVCAVAPI